MSKRAASSIDELQDDFYGPEDVSAESEDDLDNVTGLSHAVVWGTDWTAATIVDQLKRRTITLDPAFQRRDAWTDERKSRFIESLILGLPIPQLVLAESESNKGKFIVIDGKQRLLSLSKFTGVGLSDDQLPLVLKGLTIRKELNSRTFLELTSNSKFDQLVSAFENQPIRTVVVRDWKSDELLYTIFHRLNSGSVPLSPQELRQALHPGGFLSFAAKFSERSVPLRNILGLTKPDFRMRDVELVVRFYAFYLNLQHYRGNLKGFLDGICDQLNKSWRADHEKLEALALELDSSIGAAMKIFSRTGVFRKWDGDRFEKRLNRAVFDVIVHSLIDGNTRSAALKNKAKVLSAFKRLCLKEDFRSSIESTTKSKEAVRTRFSEWYRALGKAIDKKLRVSLPN